MKNNSEAKKMEQKILEVKEYTPTPDEEKQLLHDTDTYLEGFFAGKKQAEREDKARK